MSNVIHVAFGDKRSMELIHRSIEESLLKIGETMDDDPDLLRLKAARATKLLEDAMLGRCKFELQSTLPDDLTQEQREVVDLAVLAAAERGIHEATERWSRLFADACAELCTSVLKATSKPA